MSTELTSTSRARAEEIQTERWIAPACDVYENDAEWLIIADLPGVGRKALALDLDRDQLTIEARWSSQRSGVQEDCAGYRRAFTLPPGIDPDKLRAELSCGVVSVRLPKSEAFKPRRIPVKAG